MISISPRQMRKIESFHFRLNCLEFVGLELNIMEILVPAASIKEQFDALQALLDLSHRNSRLEMTMILLSKFAFHDIFTKHLAEEQEIGTNASIFLIREELIKHGYNPDFLWRKNWI